MSRCGCSKGGSGGVIVPGPGLAVTGDGTPNNPRRISIVPSPHVCDLTVDCLGGQLCRGLFMQENSCIAVGPSGDAGNVISIAAEDGGLYGSCAPAVSCGVTTDNLPPATFCAGSWGSGWANLIVGNARSYKHAVALGLPLSMARVYMTGDRVFYVSPVGDLNDSALTPRVETEWDQVTARQVRSIRVDVDDAWSPCLEPKGETIPTLDEILEITRGRHVVSLEAEREVTDGPAGVVQELVDAVSGACATKNVIIHMAGNASDADRARLAVARAAGIDTGMYLSDEAACDRHTPAELKAEGFQWVYLYRKLPDARFTAYQAEGLQVLMARAATRGDAARAQTLGLRGVMADDPGYVCGRTPARLTSPWCQPRVPAGQVQGVQLGRDSFRNRLGSHASLLTTNPASCGWRMPDEDIGAQFGLALLGWAAPMPAAYTIQWQQWWGTLDGGPRSANNFGLIISCPDESLPVSDDLVDGPTQNPGLASGYLLTHETMGAAAGTTAMSIRKITKGAAPGPNASATGTRQPLTAGVWVTFRAIVTSASITFQRLAAPGGAVDYQVVLNDTTHRGPYLWTYKQQGSGGSAAPRFATAYKDWVRT